VHFKTLPRALQEQQRSLDSQLLGGAAVAASAALLLLGPLALDAQAVSGGGGISTPLDGQDLSNQVTKKRFKQVTSSCLLLSVAVPRRIYNCMLHGYTAVE
jgi:hypothetical protein